MAIPGNPNFHGVAGKWTALTLDEMITLWKIDVYTKQQFYALRAYQRANNIKDFELELIEAKLKALHEKNQQRGRERYAKRRLKSRKDTPEA